ncbi:DUF4129 domain-containing protein [Glycomyces sp. NPDC048151]|uniref:DUF4129 domain-containing protein n=1 Tax=Glycomyces sp. NPDC048151 TaxID=3364002 RepID=UPI00371B0CF2
MAQPGTQRRRWLPVLVVVAALLVVGLAAQGAGLQWQEAEIPDATGEGDPPPPPPQESVEIPSLPPEGEPRDGFTLPGWVSWVVLLILVGIPVGLILIFLTRKLIEWIVDAPPSSGVAEPEPDYLHRDFTLVENAVNAALAEMDLGDDPRAAIMACWLHFEHASEAVGIERESSDTPADLVRKLLVRHELDGSALRRLSAAYLRARYSPHQVVEADRDQARDALVALQAQLGVRTGR